MYESMCKRQKHSVLEQHEHPRKNEERGVGKGGEASVRPREQTPQYE